MQCQFQLITGETSIGRFLRKMLPVNYGLIGLLLICFLIPAANFLLPVLEALCVVLIFSVAVIELAKIELYQTEGIVRLNETGISLNGLTIQAADLRQVEVKFSFPRGQSAGNNGIGDRGNKIIIHSKVSNKVLIANVLVEVRAQRENLAAVLKEWRKMGIKVSADGIDLV